MDAFVTWTHASFPPLLFGFSFEREVMQCKWGGTVVWGGGGVVNLQGSGSFCTCIALVLVEFCNNISSIHSYFSRTINNYLWYPNAYTTLSKRYVFFSNTGPIRVNPEGMGGAMFPFASFMDEAFIRVGFEPSTFLLRATSLYLRLWVYHLSTVWLSAYE